MCSNMPYTTTPQGQFKPFGDSFSFRFLYDFNWRCSLLREAGHPLEASFDYDLRAGHGMKVCVDRCAWKQTSAVAGLVCAQRDLIGSPPGIIGDSNQQVKP